MHQASMRNICNADILRKYYMILRLYPELHPGVFFNLNPSFQTSVCLKLGFGGWQLHFVIGLIKFIWWAAWRKKFQLSELFLCFTLHCRYLQMFTNLVDSFTLVSCGRSQLDLLHLLVFISKFLKYFIKSLEG